MSLTSNPTSLKAQLNNANPSTLPSGLQLLKVGDLLAALPARLFRKNPAAASYNLATVEAIGLPEGAHAATILRAYARASGGGTLGELAVQAYGATPADGQIAVAPNGEIVVVASAAYTDVDVEYVPEAYDVVELTLPVTSSDATIPAAYTAAPGGVLFLLEAESLAGTVTGDFIVMVPSDSAPGTTKQANLKLAKGIVKFKASDAVTSCRLKFAVVPATKVAELLEAQSTIL